MAEPVFDPALLDALARCFAEAAVRQLLVSGTESTSEANSMTPLQKRSMCSIPLPELIETIPEIR